MTIKATLPSLLPGTALAVGLAVPATAVGRALPVVGGPVTGIVLGVLGALVLRPGEALRPGIAFAAKGPLQFSVVLLGCQLSLGQVARIGLGSLPVMLGTLAACLLVAHLLGRALGVTGDLRTLVGVGTGICGASAIAAVTPLIEAAGTDVAYAVSTIFVFNVAAVLLFPPLGHLLGMGQDAFGLFAGTAVNDTSSVVAAGTAYGAAAAHYAVVVKLARTLMIVPIGLGLAAATRRRARNAAAVPAEQAERDAERRPERAGQAERAERPGGAERTGGAAPAPAAAGDGRRSGAAAVPVGRLVPWFLVGFLLTAGLGSAGWVPSALHGPLAVAATFLITVALTAIGLSTDLARLCRTGPRPLLLGFCLWITVAGTSLLLQRAVG
jgi:uncharacterized membrane protein YadS